MAVTSNGGGGVIGEGDTQWMTAGSGILHDEVPTEAFVRSGGRTHGIQLWVNLPAALKFTPPRYQAITRDRLTLLSSPDGGAPVRPIAHYGPFLMNTREQVMEAIDDFRSGRMGTVPAVHHGA